MLSGRGLQRGYSYDAVGGHTELPVRGIRATQSMSTLTTSYVEARSTLYAELPFVAAAGMGGKTRALVRNLSTRYPDDTEFAPRTGSMLRLSSRTSFATTEATAVELELSHDYVTWAMLAAAGVAAISQFLCGFNTSVMNAPEKQVFPGHATAEWSLAVAAFAVGGPVGALAAGSVANHQGRKPALVVDGLLFLGGGLVTSLAPSMSALAVGRFVVGVASGFSSVLVPLYLGELAPPVLRGAFGTMTQFALVLGILASDLLAFWPHLRWRVLFAVSPILAALQLVGAGFFLFESPRWLLDKNVASTQARDALAALYGLIDPEEVEMEVDHIAGANVKCKLRGERSTACDPQTHKAWADLFQNDAVRPVLLSCVIIHLAQQLCGINAVFYYSTLFFDGVIDNPLLGTALVAAVNVAATWLAIILMDRCGRKTLLACSSAGMLACVVAITFSLLGVLPDLASLAAVMAYVSFFEIGLGPIPWLIVAEMFELRHVDAAQSIASQVNWLANFVVGLTFPYLVAFLGPWCFLPFGLVLALTLTFVSYSLPETRGASVAEIQAAMTSHPTHYPLPAYKTTPT
ncbi:hypothetical protein CTAYLR_000931 [Chrysophaeum taylorii]|uniref:Hexose transporter 1 n=1 Tax=Chrysophaeum taylorii TaxID=2483200 RepID=A0AAD7XMR1_9STRA|nr:hypothetical protein CTAYLR_000931 [Chrysophaeum taylorii]